MAAVRGAARPSSWGPPLLLTIGLVGVDRWLRWTHGRGQVGHVIDCFPAPGESLPGFALRGVTSTLDFFAPLGLASARVPGLAIGLAAAANALARRALPAAGITGRRARASVSAIIAARLDGDLRPRPRRRLSVRRTHAPSVRAVPGSSRSRWPSSWTTRSRGCGARRHGLLAALILAVWTTVTGVRGLRAGRIEEFSPTPTLWPVEIASALRGWSEGDVLYTGRITRDRRLLALQGSALESRETRSRRRPLPRQAHGRADDPRLTQRRVVDAGPHRREDRRRARGGHAPPWPDPRPRDRGEFRFQPIAARRDDEPRVRATLAQQGLTLDRRFVFEARRGAARVGDPEDARHDRVPSGLQVFGQSALARY